MLKEMASEINEQIIVSVQELTWEDSMTVFLFGWY